MRLIDADAFKEHLAGFVAGGEKAIKETTCGNEWIDGIHTAYREINNMPTVERPRGEWKKDGFFAICSECGHELQHYELVVSWLNFCPNCGADMREGEKE